MTSLKEVERVESVYLQHKKWKNSDFNYSVKKINRCLPAAPRARSSTLYRIACLQYGDQEKIVQGKGDR